MIRSNGLYLIAILILACSACSDVQDIQDAETAYDVSLAVPLINTQLTIGTATDRLNELTSIVVDSEGKPTLKYSGELIRQDANDIFPVFPAIIDIPIAGPNSSWSLESLATLTSAFADNEIRKAIFQDNNVFFKLQHALDQDVTFTITIPEFTLNGVPFTRTYTVPPRFNEADIFNTESSSLDDYLFIPTSNSLSFEYTAVDGNGAEVPMEITAMKLDFLNFEYVEGYFGDRVFDVQGDVINVGLFDKWVSGGLEFDDPRVSIRVENSFGFPVKTDFKKLEFKTITGLVYEIESTIIDEGVAFNYPGLDEVGQVKETSFDFNKNNSNIQQIFVDKISSVGYDIDALANPDADPSISGFLNKESYFRIDVSVDLPLNGIVNELIISDTLDFDLSDLEDIESAEFKFVIGNDFPATVNVQAVILDALNNPIDVVFDTDGITLPAAPLGADGRTIKGEDFVEFVDIMSDRLETIKSGERIVLVAYIDSRNVTDDFLWLYSDYEIDFKLGAIFNVKN